MQDGGKQALELRLFNGRSFGAAHVVPHTSGGGPAWFTIDQDPSGRVYVFSESTRYSPLYHLFAESTSNGARWSASTDLGEAAQSDYFAAALDARGSGLVLGAEPAWGYPVLAGQSVSFDLKKRRSGRARSRPDPARRAAG
jgi:hypothetical protein